MARGGTELDLTADVEAQNEAARRANAQNALKSKDAFRGGHIIPGIYYGLKSIPWLLGESEDNNPQMLTGTAPLPGVGKAASTVKAAKAASGATKASKAKKVTLTVQQPSKISGSHWSEDGKKLYNSLSEAERRNFDVYLKNGNGSLENLTFLEYNELYRLANPRYHVPSPTNITPLTDRYVSPGFWDFTKVH